MRTNNPVSGEIAILRKLMRSFGCQRRQTEIVSGLPATRSRYPM